MSENQLKNYNLLTQAGRLAWCVDDLLKEKKFEHKKDIAAAMNCTPAVLSRAFGGDSSVIGDAFLVRFNRRVGFRYSFDWLLDGVGEPFPKVSEPEDSSSADYKLPAASSSVLHDDSGVSSKVKDDVAQDPLVLHLLAELKHKDRCIISLESNISGLIEQIGSRLDAMSDRIESLAARLDASGK